MRKLIITGTALAVLGLAAAAYAATGVNTYTASFGFSPTTAGTAKKPVNIGFTQTYGAKGTGGNRAAPLKDIKLSIYGLKSNGGDFPTCSAKKIATAKSDSVCPKGALIASGPVTSLLGAASKPKSPGTPCNPFLHVWNGGQGKQIFFFVIIPPKYQCGGLMTGAAAPYTATVKQVGKYMVQDTPLPPDVSTQAGGLKGIYGSLIAERLAWKNVTTKVKGKTVGYNQSVGCTGKTRPWKIQFTAQGYNGKTSVQSLSGSSKC